MSASTWPGFGVTSFSWGLFEQQLVSKSIWGSQGMEVALPPWRVNMVGQANTWADSRAIQLYFESLRGFRNQIALWNLVQPIPKGTMRGTLALSADAAANATSIQISGGIGQAGKTLIAGDLIGIGTGITQQVLRIAADSTADGSGVITAQLLIPLRNAFGASAPVEWNRPKALFRQADPTDGLEYIQSISQPWSLSLLEDWRP